jgi:hypothetical protein
MNAQQIKRKATEIAIKHVFCDIDTEQLLQEYVEFYENGFQLDDTAPTGNAVWEPFERFDEDELHTVVTDLIDSITETFTPHYS